MTVRFIQQSIDKEHQYFIGYYGDLGDLFKHQLNVIRGTFPICKRIQTTLKRQGFISLLDDELKLEYRIEVDKNEISKTQTRGIISMDMKTYLKESSRTAPTFENGLDVSDTVLEALRYSISQMIQVGNPIDDLKKHIYYGKPFAWIDPINNVSKETIRLPQYEADIIHGIVGIATEATEILEALYDHLSGKELDKTNLVEEIGDSLWYMSLLLRTIGSDFEQAGGINIEKLYKRFPHKFSGSEAINRDTVSERELLEKGVKKNEPKPTSSSIIQLN